ncbi:hypothetical protein TNCV_3221551 [Trichonephila clavipes]|nr:hypothetical protein TNCV_3221551 [Trichonephila clavipes]
MKGYSWYLDKTRIADSTRHSKPDKKRSRKKRKGLQKCKSLTYEKIVCLRTQLDTLIECGFSAVNDLLSKKRNRLDITKRGDWRLKLTKLEPDIKSLCRRHEASGFH